MNLFTRTFSKIFKSSNQQELDKIQNIILAINDKENEINDYFMEAESDNIELAIDEFDGEYEEFELRIYRIKFLSEFAN